MIDTPKAILTLKIPKVVTSNVKISQVILMIETP